jgi:hypothetical protein
MTIRGVISARRPGYVRPAGEVAFTGGLQNAPRVNINTPPPETTLRYSYAEFRPGSPAPSTSITDASNAPNYSLPPSSQPQPVQPTPWPTQPAPTSWRDGFTWQKVAIGAGVGLVAVLGYKYFVADKVRDNPAKARRAKYRVTVVPQPGYTGETLKLTTQAEVDEAVREALRTKPGFAPVWASGSTATISVEEYKHGEYFFRSIWKGRSGEWVKER